MKKIKSIIAIIVPALLLFAVVSPILAENLLEEVTLPDYLDENDIEVGWEVRDGHRQVYYLREGEKNFITKDSYNSRHPHIAGQYMTWVTNIHGSGQVFLHHIPSRTTTQLTHSTTNQFPKVSRKGKVVWQGWVDDRWQIFLFDGQQIKQITSGADVAVNPDIEDDFVVYSQKTERGVWVARGYSIQEGTVEDLQIGFDVKKPQLENGDIFFDNGTRSKIRHPLKIDDIFLISKHTDIISKVTSDQIKKQMDELATAEEEAIGDILIIEESGSEPVDQLE